ncbi:MAG: hypothetical protein M3Q19_06350 [Pseudomonadota bacterium]|nr:hypothetical protein [Pseudomonadota bacterium]
MPSEFPRSPRIRKGGLAAYRLPSLIPTIIVFQYNPDEVSRSLKLRGAQGGGRGESQRTSGPPDESLNFTVEIDAADQLESPAENGSVVTMGLHPTIAALESLLYPSFPLVVANEAIAMAGMAFIAAEQAPLTLLIWGERRVLPVRVESLTLKEQAFDTNLNPIRVAVDLSLKVQSYRDLDLTNPGYWIYMASFAQKEVLAGVNAIGNSSAIADLMPI